MQNAEELKESERGRSRRQGEGGAEMIEEMRETGEQKTRRGHLRMRSQGSRKVRWIAAMATSMAERARMVGEMWLWALASGSGLILKLAAAEAVVGHRPGWQSW